MNKNLEKENKKLEKENHDIIIKQFEKLSLPEKVEQRLKGISLSLGGFRNYIIAFKKELKQLPVGEAYEIMYMLKDVLNEFNDNFSKEVDSYELKVHNKMKTEKILKLEINKGFTIEKIIKNGTSKTDYTKLALELINRFPNHKVLKDLHFKNTNIQKGFYDDVLDHAKNKKNTILIKDLESIKLDNTTKEKDKIVYKTTYEPNKVSKIDEDLDIKMVELGDAK